MKKITAIIAAALLGLTACSSTGSEVNDDPTTAPSQAPPAATEEPAPTPTPEPEYGTFDGTGFTYEDGMEITVTGLETFEPSEYAAFDEAPAYVRFTVTITNGTGEPFDPVGAYGTLSSGGAEGGQVFDSDEGLDGTPTTAILPGKSVSWVEGYGVADPADLVYQLAPGFDYDESLFVGGL